METRAQTRILIEEIRAIVEENKRYFSEGNKRDAWEHLQYERRKKRLEQIKEELEGMTTKNTSRIRA